MDFIILVLDSIDQMESSYQQKINLQGYWNHNSYFPWCSSLLGPASSPTFSKILLAMKWVIYLPNRFSSYIEIWSYFAFPPVLELKFSKNFSVDSCSSESSGSR